MTDHRHAVETDLHSHDESYFYVVSRNDLDIVTCDFCKQVKRMTSFALIKSNLFTKTHSNLARVTHFKVNQKYIRNHRNLSCIFMKPY